MARRDRKVAPSAEADDWLRRLGLARDGRQRFLILFDRAKVDLVGNAPVRTDLDSHAEIVER